MAYKLAWGACIRHMLNERTSAFPHQGLFIDPTPSLVSQILDPIDAKNLAPPRITPVSNKIRTKEYCFHPIHGPSWRVSKNAPEFSGRQLGPWTRAVNSGSRNRPLSRKQLSSAESAKIGASESEFIWPSVFIIMKHSCLFPFQLLTLVGECLLH